jgi:site-specific DNA-methyltransferase (adenine-specific)
MIIRDRIKELRRVRASELVPHPKNWRRHSRAQAEVLKGLLAEIGYAGALLARELSDGRLMTIDGHLRAETTPDMEVPVLILDVTEEEADKILLTLDPVAAMAEGDQAAVEALLETVRTDSLAVASLFERIAGETAWLALNDPQQVVEVPARIDKAAELRVKWGTAPGQAWQAGPHKLVCGDCRDKAVVGRLWRDGSRKIRLVWSDPPYGVSYGAKNEFLNAISRGNRIQTPIHGDQMSATEVRALFANALKVAVVHAEIGMAVYATVPGGPLYTEFVGAFADAKISYRAQLTWVKQQFVIGRSDYHYRHEPILYGWLENGAHYWNGDRSQDSVFEVDKPHVSAEHPTQKPIALISQMIANSTLPGELVYDCFAGSGSTLVAAHQLGRVGYGVEIDSGYIAVALQRLADLGLEPKLIDG